jgi:Kef-type K+ transport system membrane component KefB
MVSLSFCVSTNFADEICHSSKQIGSINSGKAVVAVIVIIFGACFGKIVACTLAARAFKMPWRKSLTIGFLMNSKVRCC